jgi:hypothetical protein
MSNTCKGCNAPIKWITTPEGRKTPLDQRPTVYWVKDLRDTWRLVQFYTPHHATCPEVNQFRGGHDDRTKNQH